MPLRSERENRALILLELRFRRDATAKYTAWQKRNHLDCDKGYPITQVKIPYTVHNKMPQTITKLTWFCVRTLNQ